MKHQFQIKPFKSGYGIFLKSTPDKPLQVFPNIRAAKIRLNKYLTNVKKEI